MADRIVLEAVLCHGPHFQKRADAQAANVEAVKNGERSFYLRTATCPHCGRWTFAQPRRPMMNQS